MTRFASTTNDKKGTLTVDKQFTQTNGKSIYKGYCVAHFKDETFDITFNVNQDSAANYELSPDAETFLPDDIKDWILDEVRSNFKDQ